MNEIIDTVTSFSWWVTAVFVDIAINIISPRLDGFLSKLPSWWRDKSAIRKLAWENRVKKIAIDKDYLTCTPYLVR